MLAAYVFQVMVVVPAEAAQSSFRGLFKVLVVTGAGQCAACRSSTCSACSEGTPTIWHWCVWKPLVDPRRSPLLSRRRWRGVAVVQG